MVPPKPSTAVPRGLYNMGNTCYMNSIAQCMLHTPSIRRWVSSIDVAGSTTRNMEIHQQLALHLISDLQKVLRADHGQSRSSPKDSIAMFLSKTVGAVQSMDGIISIGGRGQQDAQEFLSLVLRGILEMEEKGTIKFDSTVVECPGSLQDTLSGSTCTALRCRSCQSSRFRTYPWSILTVPVSNAHRTLSDCIGTYVSPTIHEGLNALFCDVCKSKQPTDDFTALVSSPQTLFIHLNIFEFRSDTVRKSTSTVDLPRKYILCHPSANNTVTSSQYRLCAVVVHTGPSVHSGHYLSYVSPEGNKWFRCDDENVSSVPKSGMTFLKSRKRATYTPYLAVYEKEEEQTTGN